MNGGIVIQERPCPRCSIRRTVLIGTRKVAFCFNCRLECASSGSAVRTGRARLSMYRPAVRAGLYSEWTEHDVAPAPKHGRLEPRIARGNRPALANVRQVIGTPDAV